jgi:hypothetical protein
MLRVLYDRWLERFSCVAMHKTPERCKSNQVLVMAGACCCQLPNSDLLNAFAVTVTSNMLKSVFSMSFSSRFVYNYL